ncbi:hypothetical protein D3C71_1731440 [compost metagenome]
MDNRLLQHLPGTRQIAAAFMVQGHRHLDKAMPNLLQQRVLLLLPMLLQQLMAFKIVSGSMKMGQICHICVSKTNTFHPVTVLSVNQYHLF